MKAIVRTVLCLVLGAGLAACDTAMTGTWHDPQGDATYHFERNGRATISVLGARVPAEYTVDGDRVLVSSPQGTVVLKKKSDRLYGPMGQELVRQPE